MINFGVVELVFKKNLWIFCHYAQQPPFNTMLRYHNWGKYLQERGFDVTIVSASTVHNTSIDVITKLENCNEQYCDGVRYLYIPTPRYTGNGLSRIWNMLSYCKGIKAFKKNSDNIDCIVFCGAYLFPFVSHHFKNIPIVCDTVDLWPLSIVEYTSVSSKNIFIKFLYWIEKVAYINCDALIFSMEGGSEYISERVYAEKVNPNKIFNINMGCDLAEFDKNLINTRDQNLEKKSDFIITYSGSIRIANQILQICEAAKILQDCGNSQIKFRIFGNGPAEAEIKNYCSLNKLKNIEFYGRFNKSDIPNILSSSDANIMTYKQTGVMKYGGSQSKLFDYLASGKPIINCGDWGYNLILRYNCGIAVKEQTGRNIAEAVLALYELPKSELFEMGKRARGAAELYDQPKIVNDLQKVIEFTTNIYYKKREE